MGKTYKATITFSYVWSAADKKISNSIASGKRIPFYIHELAKTVDAAIDDVRIDDVIDDIVPRWKDKKPIKTKDFSPDVLQGYHGISLEKAIKSRYQKEFMKNAKEVYTRSSISINEISSYETKFKDDMKFEK